MAPGKSGEDAKQAAQADLTQTLHGVSNPGVHPATWSHFRDLSYIGGGGFGSVYRAWDTQLHREVALKLILPREGQEQDTSDALREARMMARVRHPNIVPVFGVAVSEGRVGIWSEFIDGASLAAIVKRQGRLKPTEAAAAVAEVCKAVGAMHAAGLLHRDIKAENVLRDAAGRVLLTDFGLSRDPASRQFGGTPRYMAPELLSGNSASAASDVYALGILLYFLATGDFPPSQNREKPVVPKQFLDIVTRATAAHPESRYSTAEGLRLALESFAPPVAPARKNRRAGLLAAMAIVLLGGAGWLIYTKTSDKPAAASGAYADYEKAHALLARRDVPGNAAASADLFSKAIVADPKFALAHAELADALWEQYRQTRDAALRERAVAEAAKALALDKELPQAFIVEGRIHEGTGERGLAMGDFRRALQLDEHNADVYRELGQIYHAEGREKDAGEAFQKAIDLDPKNWWNYNSRGTWLGSTGQTAEAGAMFEKVLEVTPDNTRGLANLAKVRRAQNRPDDARRLLEKAVSLAPRDPATRTSLGILLLEMGSYDQAAEQFRVTTELNPTSYVAWASLASATEFGAGGMEKARPLYEKTVELAEAAHRENPSDAVLAASLGDYYAALGKRDQALTLLRNAVAMAPHEVNVMFEAGEGYEILGMREQALPLITSALNGGYSAEIMKRIPELRQLISDKRFRWPAPATQATPNRQ